MLSFFPCNSGCCHKFSSKAQLFQELSLVPMPDVYKGEFPYLQRGTSRIPLISLPGKWNSIHSFNLALSGALWHPWDHFGAAPASGRKESGIPVHSMRIRAGFYWDSLAPTWVWWLQGAQNHHKENSGLEQVGEPVPKLGLRSPISHSLGNLAAGYKLSSILKIFINWPIIC